MKTDDKYLLKPVPHEEAMAFIKNKPVVSREVLLCKLNTMLSVSGERKETDEQH